MIVAVTGSRTWADRVFLGAALDQIHSATPIRCVHHGGARGADTMADEWAEANHVARCIWRPDWNTLGKQAGPLRNAKMLEMGKPNLVVAFKDKSDSRGTDDCLRKARERGIRTIVYVGYELEES